MLFNKPQQSKQKCPTCLCFREVRHTMESFVCSFPRVFACVCMDFLLPSCYYYTSPQIVARCCVFGQGRVISLFLKEEQLRCPRSTAQTFKYGDNTRHKVRRTHQRRYYFGTTCLIKAFVSLGSCWLYGRQLLGAGSGAGGAADEARGLQPATTRDDAPLQTREKKAHQRRTKGESRRHDV